METMIMAHSTPPDYINLLPANSHKFGWILKDKMYCEYDRITKINGL